MLRALFRGAPALLAVASALAGARVARAATFSDFLVQPPVLAPPERGAVGGAFAHLAFEPGSLSRGDLSLAIPIALPGERGAPLVDVLPSYSPGGAQSEWGMGWRVDQSIRRFAIVGDIDMAGDEFISPWGRLARASDGRYLPLGAAPAVALRRVDGGWVAVNGEGTTFTFAAADAVAGSYAWMLSRVDDVLGGATVLSYQRNATGRPFVTAVEWGGRGGVRQYRLELGYETLAVPLDDYRSGTRLALDRRVHDATVKVRTPAGGFETRWSYRLDYTQSPGSAAFYLTGLTRTFASGAVEPTQRFDYDFGDAARAAAVLTDVPALDPVLASQGGAALQPDKATVFDLQDDGLVDFEIAKDQALVRQQAGAFTVEPLPANPAALPQCRSPVATTNLPRTLARLTPEATEPQVFRSIFDGFSTTRVLVCDREGVPLSDQQITGSWALGPTVHLVDLNHDHRPDLVRLFSQGYQVAENTSDATGYHFVLHAKGTLSTAFTPDSSWVQDMNGDGQPDLVMRLSASSLAVWYGIGGFQFAPTTRVLSFKSVSGTTLTDINQRQLTFIDVNRDGLMDVITTKGKVLNLFLNDGQQLKSVVVPAFIGISFDVSVPVVADTAGSGEHEVLLVQGIHAKTLRLTTPATGLLVAAHDGRGTDVRFAYKRSAPAERFGPRITLLDTFSIESSGHDTVTYHYDYGAPVIHSLGRHLVGFGSVDRRAPLVTQHVEFLNDDDVAAVHALSETTDDRSPGIVQFARDEYDEIDTGGVRWLRRSQTETGHRSADGTTRLSTTTQFAVHERELCPTVVITSSPGGQQVTTTTLASVAAIPDEVSCLAGSQMLVGSHADPSRDFTYLANLTRNDVGQVTRVTQIDPGGGSLVLQDVAYNAEHLVASVAVPGRGTTTVGYDALGRLATVTDPTAVVTEVEARDPHSDALLELSTVRPGASSTASLRYDGRERLQASWDDVSGGGAAQPLASYAYQDATSTAPGRIDTQTLADAITATTRTTVALIAADDQGLVSGAWLGDHFALGAASIDFRTALTERSSFVGVMSGDALASLTSADLRGLGTPLVETVRAGFGHSVQTNTTQQAGVVGTTTRELVLTAGELITRVRDAAGFTAESAVDAAGRLVRKTDENGVVHRYAYDGLGRLVRVETPDGGQALLFDGFGRPATVFRDGIGAITYAYDAVTGLLTRKQHLDALGLVVDTRDISYDAIGRPLAVNRSAGGVTEVSPVTYHYDGELGDTTAPGQLGRLTAVRGDGWERSELFDALDRAYRQRVTLAGWRDVTRDRSFRTDGSVASDTVTVRDAGGGAIFASTKEIDLDSLGRPSALVIDGNPLYTLSYDDEGRLARADFSSGEAITFDHDPVTHRRRGHAVAATAASAPSGGVRWDLDARGLVGAETYTQGATQTRRDYSYDGRGALIRAEAGSEVASYTYTSSGLPDTVSDALGARSVHRAGGTLVVGDTTYTWDTAGRVVGKGDWSLEYGPSGQLGRASRPGRVVEYVYDDADQRLLKRIDGLPVRAEVAGGVLTEGHFVELVVVGDVVAGVLDNGQFTTLLTDPRGTPFAGSDGVPGLASPYGARVSHLRDAETIDYARLGWDPDLDLVRMGVRDYDAKLGQFLTPDPLYFEDLEKCQASPLQCTLYGYAGGNPVSFIDPTGRDIRSALRAAASFTANHIVPRAVGGLKVVGGALGVAAGLGLCEASFGLGCGAGVALASFSVDVAYSGSKELVYGKPAPTAVGQALGPTAQAIEEGAVGGAAISRVVGGVLATRAAKLVPVGGAAAGFTAVEQGIVDEVRSIPLGPLRAAFEAGGKELSVGGRTIVVQPDAPVSGMTLFGENGFVLGRDAFASDAELTKTLLHETHRLVTSRAADGVSAVMATEETEAAASFAERAWETFFQ